jgi:type I restriction enzyme M protein
VERDARYFDFGPDFTEREQIKATVEQNNGIKAQEARLHDAFCAWWAAHEPRLRHLPQTGRLMQLRAELLDSFGQALTPVGLLDRFKVDGVIASWWNESLYDLKTLAAQGFEGLVDGWVATIRAGLEESTEAQNGPRIDPLNHKLVTRLLPEYLEELAAAEARKAELESRLAATKKDDDDEADEPEELDSEELTETEIKALKKELAQAKKALQAQQKQFVVRLEQARSALSPDRCQRLVLDISKDSLAAQLELYVVAHRQQVIAAVENWWDKYRTTMCDIKTRRRAMQTQLNEFMKELGYAQHSI